MEDCIFCKIVKGEIPCFKVYEDKDFLAFLDINPNTKGMTIVVTKKHYPSYVFNMPEDMVSMLNLKEVESGERVVVGLNKYQEDEALDMQIWKSDPKEEEMQIQKLQKVRRERDNDRVASSLKQLKEAAEEGVNLVEPLLPAVKAYATIGEICDTLKDVFGEYTEAIR